MSELVGIKEVLNIAIETEDQAAATYRKFANKVESLKQEIFYTPHKDTISWKKDIGFYKELEEKVVGTDSASYFYTTLPAKVEKSDSIYFYKSLGDKFTDDVKAIFLAMAKEEEEHSATFKKILDNVDSNEGNSFKKEIMGYLKDYPGDNSFVSDITVPNTILKALTEAVEAEKQSVKFYSGMLPFANSGAIEILERIIKEELGHEAKLKSQINSYKLLIQE